MSWITLMDSDDILRVRKAGDTGYWWVLASTNLEAACGEKEAIEISGSKKMLTMGELNLVPGLPLVAEKQRKSVLETFGWDGFDELDNDKQELAWVEMASSYGLRITLQTSFGGTNESALRRALKEACVDLDGSVEHHLDRQYNRIGQTGREHLAGDMESCFRRAERREDSTDAQRLAAQLSSGTMRTVRQKNMSGECWLVQLWGLDHCKTCEYRGSAECGGKNIRKTGMNENGLTVPVS